MEGTDIHDRLKHKLLTYRPNVAAVELVRSTPLLLLVGISGAGKGTITSELLKKGGYHYIISHTTRAPRVNDGVMERDGVEYHFVTLDESDAMLDRGDYVEAKMFSGNIYGSSVAEIKIAHDSGQVAVADIEVQGVAEYEAIDPNVKVVFILPPSYEIWQGRLHGRSNGIVDHADLEKRMATALQEIEHALHDQHFTFVVNDSLAETVDEIDRIARGSARQTELAAARQVAHDLCERLKPAHAA